LDLAAAKPFPGEVIVIDKRGNLDPVPPKIDISIPIRSEDRGEDLIAALHVDYTFPSHRFFLLYPIPASTLDDLTRSIEMSFSVGEISDGCHSITVLVSHESTFSLAEFRPKDRHDMAMATWWMNINPSPEDPHTLSRCPNGGEVE
jgi:hypothetical protein